MLLLFKIMTLGLNPTKGVPMPFQIFGWSRLRNFLMACENSICVRIFNAETLCEMNNL